MQYKLNRKIADLNAYEPVSGTYNIRLDANECPFNFDDEIIEQFKTALDTINFNRYPDPLATNVAKAFADYYEIDTDFVTVSNGSDEMLSIIESTFLEKGDKLLTFDPDFSMYKFYSSIYETKCLTAKKDNYLQINLNNAIDLINREKISMVLFSNPCNPTGQGISADMVREFIRSVDSLVVLDEAYMDFWDQSLIKEADKYDNLILLRTASKAVGSAALRIGFAIANRNITNALRAVKSPYNVNSVSQKFGEIIYRNKNKLKNYQKNIVNNRNILYNKLSRIQNVVSDFIVKSTCTNFVLVKTPEAKQIYDFLLDNSIAIRFMDAYLRITAGTADEIEKTIYMIRKYYEQRGVSFADC